MARSDEFNKYDIILENILSTLNKELLLVSEFEPIKVLKVIVGTSTAKTKVLTSTVVFLLLRPNIKPIEISVTTFMNKAAKEMIKRWQILFKGTDIDLKKKKFIRTSHGMCLQVLSKFGYKIGSQKDSRIIQERKVDNITNKIVNSVSDQTRDHVNSFKRLINLCMSNMSDDSWTINCQMIKREISKLRSHVLIPE